MKPLLVLRPQPGNSATTACARTMGLNPIQCPLFAIEPVAWVAPAPAGFDALLLTSANALRCGGGQLASLTGLDTLVVGSATAEAACAAGFTIVRTGDRGVDALLGEFPGRQRLLHLAGAHRHHPATRHAIESLTVYRSTIVPVPLIPGGELVALVHSARAGARLAELALDRTAIAIAAISEAAAAACGTGWAALAWADQPRDRALLALSARLCQD